MNSLFWVALNFIGFVILLFMYIQKDKRLMDNSKKKLSFKFFGYILLSIMLFLAFDTGMFLADGMTFKGAKTLNYVFTMLFYICSPLLGLFYLLFCDINIFNNLKALKKRTVYYLIPLIINALAVILTPFTHLIFYIDEFNMYERGSFFWLSVVLTFIYIFSVFPVLAVNSKIKYGSVFKGDNAYLYLFPVPPLILTVIQIMNYGVLLIGFGSVISAFLIYINNIQTTEDKRSILLRSKNLNIIQFAVISSVMMAGMFLIIENITKRISEEYAVYNSTGTAHIFETYLNKEIGVLGSAARSKAVAEWTIDEFNEEKKLAAFEELMSTLDGLYNNNIYIVAGASGNEYSIDKNTKLENFNFHAAISRENPKDEWVFNLLAGTHDYNLNVDVDKELNRKRVWLNYKIKSEGETVGIICTGMDFSIIARQALRLRYSNTESMTFIIDENGIINMDSALQDDEDFLVYGVVKNIKDEITDPDLLSAIQKHLDSIEGYFPEMIKESEVIQLSTGRQRYATITPIGTTSWTKITLYDSSSLFGIINLLPLLFIITVMFIISAYISNTITTKLIITPLKKLIESLNNMRNNNEQNIYGIERGDEIGLLSNAIRDFFVKGYYDELTGIYNRRYLETTMQQIMNTLSRTEYKLSVMFIDIDHFKKYNDLYGHGEGDKCLKIVAETLNKAITRKGDFIARYGGEEFTVVLPHADEEGAKNLAENMLCAIRSMKIPHAQGDTGFLTVSIGVTTGNNTQNLKYEDYFKKADEALYISKKEGRNRFTFIAL